MYRRIIIPLLALGVLCGCDSRKTNVERGNEARELYVGIVSEPSGLDPQLVTGIVESYYILSGLIEGLVTRNAKTLAIEPGVAASWEISEDGKTYTFHFDPEARWSTGDPVTSEDFLFSYERILSPGFAAPNAYMLFEMKGAAAFNKGLTDDFSKVGVKAPDLQTLVIELNHPTPYFLSLLTHQSWYPVHPQTILKYGTMTDRISDWTKAGNFVGNGPFTLEKWQVNNGITLKKNPDYHDAANVWLNRVHLYAINVDAEERAFRAGFLHVTYNVPSHRIDWYRENHPDLIRFDTYLGTYYYGLNVTRGPLTDKRVRQALAYSIDREALTTHVMKGGQKPAYNFTPPNTGGYTAKPAFSYDPERARELLAEAGYPGGKDFPKMELLYNTSDEHKPIALAIQQMWQTELGIKIELHSQEWKAYLATRKSGEFDIMRAGWIGDYDDPHTFLGLSTQDSGNNHSRFANDEYDQLIEMASTVQDPEARFDVLRQAEALLMEEMPVIPIYFYVRSGLYHPSVKGWYPNVLDYHPYTAVRLEQD